MAMRDTPGWLGITPLPRPSGERCLSQAGEFACPWASTEFPDLASHTQGTVSLPPMSLATPLAMPTSRQGASSEVATSVGHVGRPYEQASPGAAG